MSNWNKVFKPIVVLSIICIVVTGALAFTNEATAPIIEAATLAAQEQARTELFPDATGFTRADGEFEGVSDVYVTDNNIGTVVTCAAKGYSSTITVMVAFTPDGTIERINITEQGETAGVGTKIISEESFQQSFEGLEATALELSDIDTITGATISSKATVSAVNYAIAAYAAIS